jgi:hypothetical protein
VLHSIGVFENDGDKVTRLVFGLGNRMVAAQRVE